ncbi:MAG: DUF3078 domain-containing protein [Rhodothermales bacterium]
MTTIFPHSYRMILCGILVLFFLAPVNAYAQDEVVEDSTAWKKNLVASLAGSQASYDNWAEGGINSLAFAASLNGDANRTTQNWIQKHEMRLALGSLKQDSTDFRKADDLIQFLLTFQYQNDDTFAKWHPTGAFELRTQFANGFDYSGAEAVKVSALFSPATLQQTFGFTYQPEDWFTWLIGLAAKETVVGIEELRPNYGNDLDETVRFEAGLSSKASVDRDIFENVNLKTSLGVFTAFDQFDKPDIRWDNLITMSVNSWLTVNFEFVTFYDLDISDKVQLKQVLSTGISIGLL